MSTTHKPIVRINSKEVECITDLTATITLMPDGRHRYEVDVTTAVESDESRIDRVFDRTVVARPIVEAEASWWEGESRVGITVRREVMNESVEDAERHVQRVIDIILNG